MKLFVTGATGFIGCHFVEAALRAGHAVVALRRLGSVPRITSELAPLWVEGALDADHSEALHDVDVLVHLASHTANPPYASLPECLHWNVAAPIRLAEQAVQAGVRKFVVAGSCFEYGAAAERAAFVSVDTPLEPALSYPTSKAAASMAFAGLAREKGVSVQILRIFQVYGEGEQASRFWPSLRRAALEGHDFPMSAGTQLRDFIDVKTVAAKFLAALDFAGIEPGVPFVGHIGTGQGRSLLEFAQEWWAHWGATGRLIPDAVPLRKNEIMRLVPSSVV